MKYYRIKNQFQLQKIQNQDFNNKNWIENLHCATRPLYILKGSSLNRGDPVASKIPWISKRKYNASNQIKSEPWWDKSWWFGYVYFISIDFYDFISVVSVVFVLIEVYLTLKRLFYCISKLLDVCQSYLAACHIFNSLLSVLKCD